MTYWFGPIPTNDQLPPERHMKLAGLHWLKEYSQDKSFLNYVVLQWQPGAKEWCEVGKHLRGQSVSKDRLFIYVSPCQAPLEEHEIEAVSSVLKNVHESAVSDELNITVSKKTWKIVEGLLRQVIP